MCDRTAIRSMIISLRLGDKTPLRQPTACAAGEIEPENPVVYNGNVSVDVAKVFQLVYEPEDPAEKDAKRSNVAKLAIPDRDMIDEPRNVRRRVKDRSLQQVEKRR